MPAKHSIDNESKLIITKWVGDATDALFVEAIKKYHKDIQSQPEYSDYNEVVDFTEATNIKLTADGLKELGEIASSTDRHGPNRKLALIVSSNVAFGLARMYEVYRSITKRANKQIRVFRDKDEAFDWLRSKSEALKSS